MPLDQSASADRRVTVVVRVRKAALALWAPWVPWVSPDLPATQAQPAPPELWENPETRDNRDPAVLLATKAALVTKVLKAERVQMDLLVKLVLLATLEWKALLGLKVLRVPWVLLVHKEPVVSPVEGVVLVQLVKMVPPAIRVLKESRDLVVPRVRRVLRDLPDRQVPRACPVLVVARAPRVNPDLRVHLERLETPDLEV